MHAAAKEHQSFITSLFCQIGNTGQLKPLAETHKRFIKWLLLVYYRAKKQLRDFIGRTRTMCLQKQKSFHNKLYKKISSIKVACKHVLMSYPGSSYPVSIDPFLMRPQIRMFKFHYLICGLKIDSVPQVIQNLGYMPYPPTLIIPNINFL